jgi:DNA modification methylase
VFKSNDFELHLGHCAQVMQQINDASIDAIVTDPPYELGFMGKAWDATGIANDPRMWAEALRVLKPGGHLLAFSGTRTYHRMVCAIEDAGFEIRDQIGWLYGSGFPKSHNGEWGGTALKPAWEPIVLARKPLIGTVEANWREHGTGALNIDGCRVPAEVLTGWGGGGSALYEGGLSRDGGAARPAHGRWPANVIHDGSDEVIDAFPPAPGQLAKASTSDTQRADQNVHGVMTRGSTGQAPRGDAGSAARFFYCAKASKSDRNAYQRGKTERANTHPTVKPTELMRYLCRLVTPPGGVVLDPFNGSGSTGKAAVQEGFRYVGIDMSAEYLEISKARIQEALYGHLA